MRTIDIISNGFTLIAYKAIPYIEDEARDCRLCSLSISCILYHERNKRFMCDNINASLSIYGLKVGYMYQCEHSLFIHSYIRNRYGRNNQNYISR